ncbi:subtilisin family serine protease [Novosphingobium hassiacum]|uniref:Subtilisin family serine protease n=1 Tax=Novosphingobium hassiacum TaxID=173676 RepID=A0A7W6EWY8_9SPHN|nr:S8 family serine peptidase [Novosphingobium hassiacum]MBB3861857.1 subtilisin family serine protease [Novosphingobium hassiacum]
MRKFAALATVSVVALAGVVFAAAGGNKVAGAGAVLLPASAAAGYQVSAAPTVAAAPGSAIPDSWICVFKAGSVPAGNEQAEANRVVGKAGGRVGHVYRYALQGFSINLPAPGAAAVAAHNPNIDHCAPDQIATIIDPVNALARPGGGGGATSETTPVGITRVGGGLATYTGTGRAFVIDSGVDLTHPDLVVSTTLSRNFVSRETSPNDLNGHGSHVAGTIAAKKGNSLGVVGVAPGATIIAVRVLDRRGSGAYSDVIAGVDYVATPGVGRPGDVANMSLGGPVSTDLDTAVINASNSSGVIFALAAGNETDDANNHSPARADGPNIYTIAAVNASDTFASFSNYSVIGDPVDFAEPGVSILSTWKDGGYNTISGTSMATPHMAGILLYGRPGTSGQSSAAPNGVRFPIGIKP